MKILVGESIIGYLYIEFRFVFIIIYKNIFGGVCKICWRILVIVILFICELEKIYWSYKNIWW